MRAQRQMELASHWPARAVWTSPSLEIFSPGHQLRGGFQLISASRTRSGVNRPPICAKTTPLPHRQTDGENMSVGIVVLSGMVGIVCAILALLMGLGWLGAIGIYILAGMATALLLVVFVLLAYFWIWQKEQKQILSLE